MKSKVLLIFLLIFSSNFAQVEIKPEIGIAGTFAVFGVFNGTKNKEFINKSDYEDKRHDSNYGYVGLNAYSALRLYAKNHSYLIGLNYQYLESGNFIDYITKEDVRKSNLLGIGLGMRFLERSKFKPFVSAQLFSEFCSNYKNRYIKSQSYGPSHKQAMEEYDSYHYGHGTPPTLYYQASLYQSTPFFGNFYGGCDFSLMDGFDLKLSVGYNLTVINYKYANFRYDKSVKENHIEKLRIAPISSVALHSFSMQLGFRYTIPLKLNASMYD